MVTHVNTKPDEQYQFGKVVNLGPPIHQSTLEGHSKRKNAQTDKKMAGPEGSDPGYHQSKLSNENCNILQSLTISKFCRNWPYYNIMISYLPYQNSSLQYHNVIMPYQNSILQYHNKILQYRNIEALNCVALCSGLVFSLKSIRAQWFVIIDLIDNITL